MRFLVSLLGFLLLVLQSRGSAAGRAIINADDETPVEGARVFTPIQTAVRRGEIRKVTISTI